MKRELAEPFRVCVAPSQQRPPPPPPPVGLVVMSPFKPGIFWAESTFLRSALTAPFNTKCLRVKHIQELSGFVQVPRFRSTREVTQL